MSFWTAIVIIVAIGAASEMYKYRVKLNARSPKDNRSEELLASSVGQLEKRVSNLETLIIEHDKLRKFDNLAELDHQQDGAQDA
jgi:hypothetical protein